MLISETRGGAQTSGSERHQGMGADGLTQAWLWLRFMRGIRFKTRNIKFLGDFSHFSGLEEVSPGRLLQKIDC